MKKLEPFVFQQDLELGGRKFIINEDLVTIFEKRKDGDRETSIRISEISSDYHRGTEILARFFIITLILIGLVVLPSRFFVKYLMPQELDDPFSLILTTFEVMWIGGVLFYYSFRRCRPIEVTYFKDKYGAALFKIYRPFDNWWDYDEFIKTLTGKLNQ